MTYFGLQVLLRQSMHGGLSPSQRDLQRDRDHDSQFAAAQVADQTKAVIRFLIMQKPNEPSFHSHDNPHRRQANQYHSATQRVSHDPSWLRLFLPHSSLLQI